MKKTIIAVFLMAAVLSCNNETGGGEDKDSLQAPQAAPVPTIMEDTSSPVIIDTVVYRALEKQQKKLK